MNENKKVAYDLSPWNLWGLSELISKLENQVNYEWIGPILQVNKSDKALVDEIIFEIGAEEISSSIHYLDYGNWIENEFKLHPGHNLGDINKALFKVSEAFEPIDLKFPYFTIPQLVKIADALAENSIEVTWVGNGIHLRYGSIEEVLEVVFKLFGIKIQAETIE